MFFSKDLHVCHMASYITYFCTPKVKEKNLQNPCPLHSTIVCWLLDIEELATGTPTWL